MNTDALYIGLMSGTSMDGIDVALTDVSSHQLIAGKTYPYSKNTLKRLKKITKQATCHLNELAILNHMVGEEFARAILHLIKDFNIDKSRIKAIGSHGQTILHNGHQAPFYTMQIGCPHTIKELVQLPVVADFRACDMVLKGQGAPLAPIYHDALFKKMNHPIIVVNIGGITNLSVIHPYESPQGYDIGPGNCLMDDWAFKHRKCLFDKDGAWASSGQLNLDLLNALLTDPFFKKDSPKSIDKAYFSLYWLKSFLRDEIPNEDVQNTLLHLTAWTIAQEIQKKANTHWPIYICGGGAHNQALLQQLSNYLENYQIKTLKTLNLNPDFIEAMMFAWLAERRMNQHLFDLSSVTGSIKPLKIGTIYD